MIEPQLAPVRPRITLPGEVTPVLLEDELRDCLDAGQCGLIELYGLAGAGKTTALSHLAHVFAGDPRVRFLDDVGPADLPRLFDVGLLQLAVYSTRGLTIPNDQFRLWAIASWSLDEWIEYLLSSHKSKCASVMGRINSDKSWGASWNPAACRIALDQLALDESLVSAKAALRRAFDQSIITAGELVKVREACFESMANSGCSVVGQARFQELLAVEHGPYAALHRYGVMAQFAAEHLVEVLRTQDPVEILSQRLRLEIVQEAGALIHDDSRVLRILEGILAPRPMDLIRSRRCQSMAASLLHAALETGLPPPKRPLALAEAYLGGVCWPGLQLRRLQVIGAVLTDADLSEARLQRVDAEYGEFRATKFHGARLLNLTAHYANFSGADLSNVRAAGADFKHANLSGANLEGALLNACHFDNAILVGANFARADLRLSTLSGCRLNDANFAGADFSWAEMLGLELCRASFLGAKFERALMDDCNFEGMQLPGAIFKGARLDGSTLTGSQMPHANFRSASLCCAKLAEISWEQADLRDANLKGATFHFGSSRSGLVDSPIACEGSKTGFYTDEEFEQYFKAPEEIRKANLRGADLRGANITGVDFYLVDLRDAKYSPDQEQQLRSTGAILETRV